MSSPFTIVSLILLVLKVLEKIDITWFQVALPILIGWGIALVIWFIVASLIILRAMFD